MALFSRQKLDEGRLHYILRMTFNRVKSDMHNIVSWIDYFHKKHQEHESRLDRIEKNISYTTTKEEVKQLIDTHYSSGALTERVKEIHERIDEMESQIRKNTVEKKEFPARTRIQDRLLRKITKSSKEYVKSVILGIIKKYGRITGPELKEIVVNEQGLCSKSSLYRLLREIEDDATNIGTFSDRKERTYFIKTEIIK